jgi:Fe2+ or Zn2+ uptake regulation protein
MEFLLLSILLSNNAISKMSGMTVSDILAAEDMNYKENTFYKQLKAFNDQGLVGIGAKERRALTFYITNSGIRKLKEEKEDEK